jgi:AraC-like DNA-binding protein
MLRADLPRSAASARVLLAFAREHALDEAALLRGTAVTAADAPAPNEISSLDELRLVENLVRLDGTPDDAGLQVGTRASLAMFGMFGFAVMSSPTLLEAWRFSLRYQDLAFTLARVALVEERGRTYLELDLAELPDAVHRFVVDHFMGTCMVAVRALDADAPRPSIDLVRHRPVVDDPYVDAFGFAPTYGRPADRFGYPDQYLRQPRPEGDPAALDPLREQCKRLLAQRQASIGTAGIVRERLRQATHLNVRAETIAADLHLSERTLRRHLENEGTSFQALADAARRERAEQLLSQSELSVEAIAGLLGYATPSAFGRAFRRWHSESPGYWRVSGRT